MITIDVSKNDTYLIVQVFHQAHKIPSQSVTVRETMAQ